MGRLKVHNDLVRVGIPSKEFLGVIFAEKCKKLRIA